MKLVGNIQDISNRRNDKNRGIEFYIDKISYITNRKDGKYFQPYEFIDELDAPLVITGDCLAKINSPQAEEGEHYFQVYDQEADGTYTRNTDKELEITTVFDYESGSSILRSVEYTVTVSNEEFSQIKKDRSSRNKQRKGSKGR